MDQELEQVFLTGLEKNKQKLLRVCSVYAHDEDDRKDLFQEVLVNIWKSMPSFKANAAIGTWMFRVTLNVCLRMQTKQTKKKKQFINMDSVELSNYEGHYINEEENDELKYMRECIKKLDDADKAVITLFLEELPYRDIAEITGITENHVAVKIKRIKKKLLNCINERS